ncbi:MAG: hypothetical protein AABX38_00115 [Candidatus Micrarchaeota archaeon]
MNPNQLVKLLLPLFLIPLTLYSVSLFGHDAGNAVIGIAFFIAVVKFANESERKYMIILAVFASIFESVNVISGGYKYIGAPLVPLWVGLGWGILGLYLVKNVETFKSINNKNAYILSAIFFSAVWVLTGASIPSLVFLGVAISTTYVLSLSSKFPASFFLFTGVMGVVIEFFGTSVGVWKYFLNGLPIDPPLLALSMAYCSVIAFGIWLSRID